MDLQVQAKEKFEAVTALAVKTQSARQQAADLWDAIRAFRKQAEAQKEETCRPLKVAWEQGKAPFDAFVKECQGHEATLQQKMGAWDREQERIAREEQAKIQAKIDAENAKRIEKAEAKGVEPVLKVAPVVQAPPKSVETQAGTTQTRSVKKSYRLKGVTDSEWNGVLRANHPRCAELLASNPGVFILSEPAFNKLAATGALDNLPYIEVREEYIYTQRGMK
jgi:hypothetical protein